MNRIRLFILLFFVVGYVEAQTPKVSAAAATGYRIKYDHRALRIPGNIFQIGLVVPAEGKKPADTIGYPGKSGGWGKYHVEVDSGSFSGGKVKLRASKLYKKWDSVTVNVYTRKWLLGGRGKFLVSRKIPYDYEDSIRVMTNSNTGRWPGGHVSFGVRTFYDDRQTVDLWYPVKKKNSGDFLLGFEGGHLSRKKGDWKIDPDPTHIHNDEVKLSARLVKAPAIRDTLGLLLNYTAPFQCGIFSSGDGHELDVSIDAFEDSIIHEKLLKIEVRDSAAHRTYHYLVNTEGGSMSIFSKGADGAKGDDGLNGTDGQSGADGAISQMPVTSTDAQGNVVTTYVDVQGPGGDGGNGGDGEDGGNGYAGDNGGNITISYTLAASPYLKLISARSVPGAGGAGGDGGKGGNGGSGGSGAPSGQSGHRGRDGNSGTSGQNGHSGTVRLAEIM